MSRRSGACTTPTSVASTPSASGWIGDAIINGGQTTGLLKMGLVEIYGDFAQSGSISSYDAGTNNVAFTTRFTGSSAHNVTFANPGSSRFGTLDYNGTGGGTLQLQSGIWTNNFQALSGTVLSSDIQLYTIMGMNVSGTTFDNTRVLYDGPSGNPTFGGVTFVNMNTALPQLKLNFNGSGTVTFTNVDFENAGANFVEATSIFSNPYTLRILGSDNGIGPARSSSPDLNVTFDWQPPS